MATTLFVPKVTVISSDWCNDVNRTQYVLMNNATTTTAARTALGVAASGANSDITSLTGVTSITGTVTNDSAAAGKIGEFVTATVTAGSPVTGTTTGASKNVTSITLTAGDWDVGASVVYALTGVTATIYSCGLGTTTGTLLTQAGGGGVGTDPLIVQQATWGTTITGTFQQMLAPVRVSLAAGSTIYLVANVTFSAGSYNMYGTLRARRVR